MPFNRMNFTISPFLMKELRSRMRDNKTPVWTTAILLLTALTIVVVMYTALNETSLSKSDLSNIGTITFYIITGALFLFSAVTSLTVSAASFAIEREQETLEMLLLTRMSSLQMVMGKIFGSMAFILYITVLFIPIAAVSFIFGGISPWQLIQVFVIIISSAFFYSTIGTFSSIAQKKSNGAVILSFVTAIYFLVGFPALLAIPVEEIFNSFIVVVLTFFFLYFPFILVMMELTIPRHLFNIHIITKISIGLLYYIPILILQGIFSSILHSSTDIVLALNPISVGISIFNKSILSLNSLPVLNTIIYLIFISILSAAFIKMAVTRINFMRRGIG